MVSLLLIVLFSVAAIVLLLAPRPTVRLSPVARIQSSGLSRTPARARLVATSADRKMSRTG